MTKKEKIEHASGKLVSIMEQLCSLTDKLRRHEDITGDMALEYLENMVGLWDYAGFSNLHNLFKSIYNQSSDLGKVNWEAP